jgi:hypothetical protein
MKYDNYLRKYISRILHQTIVQVTGGVGFIITAISEILFPGQLIRWVFYLILLSLCIVVAGYSVYIEVINENNLEIKRLSEEVALSKRKIQEIEDKQPKIEIGVSSDGYQFEKEAKLGINPLPDEPHYDELIDEKRKELLNKRLKQIEENKLTYIVQLLMPINEKYEEDVEKYLIKYREYLDNIYYRSIINDRAKFINIYVSNRGLYPINDLTIEINIPQICHINNPEIEKLIRLVYKNERILPKEPDIFINPINYEPINYSEFETGSPIIDSIANKFVNTTGPEMIERGDDVLAIYKANKLIQYLTEKGFSPFLLWLGNIEETTILEFKCVIFAEEAQKPITTSFNIQIDLI